MYYHTPPCPFQTSTFILYDLTVGSFKKGRSNGYWALFFKKVYVPIFELFQKLCELFPCIVKLPAAPLEKNTVKVMQFRLDEKNRKPPRARNVTTFFFCLALTYCVLQVCRLACMCLCVSLTPRWWAGVRKHVGDTLDFSQFLVFSCKPLLSAMWHLCASTPAICINSGAASPSKNTHTCTPTALLLSLQRGLQRLLFGYWLFVV